MNKIKSNIKNNWKKYIMVLMVAIVILSIVYLTFRFAWSTGNESDRVTMVAGWISGFATVLLGGIAIYQGIYYRRRDVYNTKFTQLVAAYRSVEKHLMQNIFLEQMRVKLDSGDDEPSIWAMIEIESTYKNYIHSYLNSTDMYIWCKKDIGVVDDKLDYIRFIVAIMFEYEMDVITDKRTCTGDDIKKLIQADTMGRQYLMSKVNDDYSLIDDKYRESHMMEEYKSEYDFLVYIAVIFEDIESSTQCTDDSLIEIKDFIEKRKLGIETYNKSMGLGSKT